MSWYHKEEVIVIHLTGNITNSVLAYMYNNYGLILISLYMMFLNSEIHVPFMYVVFWWELQLIIWQIW